MPDKKSSIKIPDYTEEFFRDTFIKPSGKKSAHYGLCFWIEVSPMAITKTLNELEYSISKDSETDKILTKLARRIPRLDQVLAGEQLLNLLNDKEATDIIFKKDYHEKTIFTVFKWLEAQPYFNRLCIDIKYISMNRRRK